VLPRIDGFALLEDGSLLFFLEHEYASEEYSIEREQRFARVVDVPTGVDTVAVEKPPAGHDGHVHGIEHAEGRV
jgi:hypothetical protein